MSVLYSDDFFEVRSTWFGWRVFDRSRGATVVPTLIAQERIGFVWKRLRSNKELSRELRDCSEAVMFEAFAQAAIEPRGSSGVMFATIEPGDIVEICIGRAAARLSLRRLYDAGASFPDTRAERPSVTEYSFPSGDMLWLDGRARAWAGSAGQNHRVAADASELVKFWEIHDAFTGGRFDEVSVISFLTELRFLFAKVVMCHRREQHFFRSESVEFLVASIVMYAESKKAQ